MLLIAVIFCFLLRASLALQFQFSAHILAILAVVLWFSSGTASECCDSNHHFLSHPYLFTAHDHPP
jgi:hypothetical protein